MSNCEYLNATGHCILNECMYQDFDGSIHRDAYPTCHNLKDNISSGNDNTLHTNCSSEWITDRLPNDDSYILLSFSNASTPEIGRYEADKDGGGAFYIGDDDQSCSQFNLFVNAWMPLPRSWRGGSEL